MVESIVLPFAELPRLVFWIVTAGMQFAFALGVRRNAVQLARSGDGPDYVKPFTWGIATLIGGVWVVAVYGLIHHSVLRRRS